LTESRRKCYQAWGREARRDLGSSVREPRRRESISGGSMRKPSRERERSREGGKERNMMEALGRALWLRGKGNHA